MYTKTNMKHGIPNAEYGIWNTEYRIENTEYGIYRILNTKYRIPTHERRIMYGLLTNNSDHVFILLQSKPYVNSLLYKTSYHNMCTDDPFFPHEFW